MAIKHKEEHRAHLSHRSVLLRKVIQALSTYRQQSQSKQEKRGQTDSYYDSLLLMKALEAMKHFVFVLRKIKKQKKFKSLRFWARRTKQRVMNSLKAYRAIRVEKKKRY